MSTDTDTSESWEALREEAAERVDSYEPQNRPDEAILKASLHAFLQWLPEKGRSAVARDIKHATSDNTLYDVFHNLFTCLAAPMKARSQQPSVTDSPHGKRQEQLEAVASKLDQPSTRTEDFRKLCLKRDGYRCVVTGQMDVEHWIESNCPADIPKGLVEAAHIIPFSYGSWDKASAPPHGTSSAWTFLYRCFPDVLEAGMKPENINNLWNGMTLRNALHVEFGRFSLAFKPTVSTKQANIHTVIQVY
jgi:hypothetical protein